MPDLDVTHHAPASGASKLERRWTTPLGASFVLLALVTALSSFLIFAGYTPIPVNDTIVLSLFVANIASILLLFGLVLVEAYRLYAAWRSKVAGARLHLRIVALFSIVAAAPALLMAWVGSVTLERSLNPSFMQDVRGFVLNTIDAARLFREGQCKALLQEASLTAADLDRAKTVMFEGHRELFRDFFASRAKFLGFTAAALMKSDGQIVERIDTHAAMGTAVVQPEPSDFEDARKNEPLCLILDEGGTFVALRPVSGFPDTFLYVARPVDRFTVAFPREASKLVAIYDAFDSHRRGIQIAFAAMFVSIALIMVLAATWLGLSFANQLVAPIRRLIAATDQVASGNLSVQVAVYRDEGDLARLGETFNKMIAELRLQQNRLIAASNLIDERRLFTEAVLSGVPVAVVGIGPKGLVTVLNASAEKLVPMGAEELTTVTGQPVEAVLPEIADLFNEARASTMRLMQGQISLDRGGRDRLFNVSITSEPTARTDKSYVVTLDDITDLVTAQRTAAWADVARRIAHEIKNPLTPIQLSAERLKRKYGRVIVQDRDIFDQCIDTIVRQVDDIKRMVDEFSSFARMPKAKLDSDDLTDCLRRVLFLMRVAHPDITFDEDLPEKSVIGRFDRRLLSQAVTNILKNAAEGIAAVAETEQGNRAPGRILLRLLVRGDQAEIDIIDNGKGFPRENRHRLLEPYMTTRAEGTGLGLPIVAKILEDHGGSLELLDAPDGQGAFVKLLLPLGGAQEKEPRAPVALLSMNEE
ncbi:sensor histidine kinase NtrY-like [Beijerinckia indica]|uniref:histidine kinase n=1 Tax=Beijerinckia indica subsp. indica (strain ATCC 9039 / DSM 1715 / NCIMB 8712) TaxID=395963 RepID=B2IB69_BEII9|nr:PAS domain-containing sensor histidine kinase [Beijerinckia indica]ACB95153.1 multi-sensor signal transduction histidine kinase [Beijerinckia indica subsp. indica ATCC 9039]